MTGLAIGTEAPDFTLRDQHGRTVVLSTHRGRAVVLVFYPWAFSYVCGTELATLRDRLPEFENDEVQVLAVSCDPMHALRAYSEADGLTFPLLSDHWPHGAVARAYGVFNETTGAADRSTYVVDREGRIAWAVHNDIPDARSAEDYAEVLRRLRNA